MAESPSLHPRFCDLLSFAAAFSEETCIAGNFVDQESESWRLEFDNGCVILLKGDGTFDVTKS